MLDGYLTAIVIGPCSIPPNECFVHLLGERDRIARASGTTMAAITATVTRFDAISQFLCLAPNKHAPLVWKAGYGLALRHRDAWAFLAPCGYGSTSGVTA